MNDSDVPDIPEDYHSVILAGAIARNGNFVEDNPTHARYKREFVTGLEQLKAEDNNSIDEWKQVKYDSPVNLSRENTASANDIYLRGMS